MMSIVVWTFLAIGAHATPGFVDEVIIRNPCEGIQRTNTKNIILPANYKVYLDNCGARPRQLAVETAPTVTTAAVETPPVVLPFKIPPPRTVSNTCKCVKTVVKPQIVQRVIRVPVIKKFIQTLARPTYEVINYTAEPINCPQIDGYETYDYERPCSKSDYYY